MIVIYWLKIAGIIVLWAIFFWRANDTSSKVDHPQHIFGMWSTSSITITTKTSAFSSSLDRHLIKSSNFSMLYFLHLHRQSVFVRQIFKWLQLKMSCWCHSLDKDVTVDDNYLLTITLFSSKSGFWYFILEVSQ